MNEQPPAEGEASAVATAAVADAPVRAEDPAKLVRDLIGQFEELRQRIRLLEAEARHRATPWAQRVFLVQPDGGGTLYSEAGLTFSGTNPTTSPLSDLGGIARSFLKGNLATPASGAFGVMEFDNGTSRVYVRIPGGVDLLQADTNVISSTPFLNMATNRGTAGIFEFVPATVGGVNGANLQFKSGGSSNRAGIYWSTSSNTWIIDYLRFT